MANFPLLPFANRIRGGSFECDGVLIRLTPNMTGDPSPLHGQSWQHPWTVQTSESDSATLYYLHESGEWPWRYEAWQVFQLSEHGLSIRLSCRNLSPRRMPCGLAHHPYFPCDDATILDVAVGTAWTADEHALPVARVSTTGRFDLRNRRIGNAGLDNAFEDWDGTADIIWQGEPMWLRMTSPDAQRFHVYSPVGETYFAAEPVQNAITALNSAQSNWAGLGITLLEQGEAHEMNVSMDILCR